MELFSGTSKHVQFSIPRRSSTSEEESEQREAASLFEVNKRYEESFSQFSLFAHSASSRTKPSSEEIHIVTVRLLDMAHAHRPYVQDSHRHVELYSSFVTRLLGVQKSTLTVISDSFKKRTRLSSFMIKNYFYVAHGLRQEDNMDHVNAIFKRIEAQIYEDISYHISKFLQQFWQRVMSALGPAELLIVEANQPISKEDKNLIKRVFSSFNNEFHRASKSQRKYKFENEELRVAIIRESIDFILSRYEKLHNECVATTFSRTPSKYIFYTPGDIRREIAEFFKL